MGLEKTQSDSGLDILDKECNQLKKALCKLEKELSKTNELLQNLFDYIHERHIIRLPVHPYFIKQYERVMG